MNKFTFDFFKEDLEINKSIIKEDVIKKTNDYKREKEAYDGTFEYYKDLKKEEQDEFRDQGVVLFKPSQPSIESPNIILEDPYFFFCTDDEDLFYISSYPLNIKNKKKKIVSHTDHRASHLRYKERSGTNKNNIFIKKGVLEKIEPIEYHEELNIDLFDVQSFIKKGEKISINRKKNTSGMGDISRLMRQEQDEIMRAPTDGITLITGVAGSGKTNILLHRIQYLLWEHPENFSQNRILFLCYNVSLQKYVHKMVKNNFSDLNIQTLDKRQKDIFMGATNGIKHYIIDFEYKPTKQEIESIEKNVLNFMDTCNDLHEFIISKEISRNKIKDIGTETIIELKFNIALFLEKLVGVTNIVNKYHIYLSLYLLGCISIDQKKLSKSAIVKIGKISFEYTHSNTNFTSVKYILAKPTYDHIFIDEVQDLLPIQIKILNGFHNNSMTLAGDETQLLSQNHSKELKSSLGIDIDNIYSLETSHRVSLQTALFANSILTEVKVKSEIKKIGFSGLKPIIKKCSDNESVYIYLSDKIKNLLSNEPSCSICITLPSNEKLSSIQEYLKKEGVNCYVAKGSERDFSRNIHITTYYQAKGLEFDYMFILGVNDFYSWNIINKDNVLYTLITRAIKRIYLPIQGNLPNILGSIDENLYELQ